MADKLLTWSEITGRAKEVLERAGVEVVIAPLTTQDNIIENARNADAVLIKNFPFTKRVIAALIRCKVISRGGVGYDSIDVSAATEHGIIVTNVPDANTEEVSDHTVALLLALSRRIVVLDRAVKAGLWTGDKAGEDTITGIRAPMRKIKGKTLGQVGMGRIGAAVVSKAKGFGLKIIVYDPYLSKTVADEAGVELVDLDRLLHESDFICLNVPLTPETRGMFGLKQFTKMKPTAYIINTGRGGLIDEDDLYSALSQRLIAGAALDVLAQEPPGREDKLLKLENVICTAHSAWYSAESVVDSRLRAVQAIVDVLQGRWPQGVVNPEVRHSRHVRFCSKETVD